MVPVAFGTDESKDIILKNKNYEKTRSIYEIYQNSSKIIAELKIAEWRVIFWIYGQRSNSYTRMNESSSEIFSSSFILH